MLAVVDKSSSIADLTANDLKSQKFAGIFLRVRLGWWLSLAALGPVFAQAQFNYVTNNGSITIVQYTGAGGAVVIPDTMHKLRGCATDADDFQSGNQRGADVAHGVPGVYVAIGNEFVFADVDYGIAFAIDRGKFICGDESCERQGFVL